MNGLQSVFNRVALHLLQQGRRSVAPYSTACQYRGQDGTKCAVGFLISDQAYHSYLEGRGVLAPEVTYALHESGVPLGLPAMHQMLHYLQGIHDKTEPKNWLRDLRIAARRFGLTMPALADECMPAPDNNATNEAEREKDARRSPADAGEVSSDGQVEWYVV